MIVCVIEVAIKISGYIERIANWGIKAREGRTQLWKWKRKEQQTCS
jgi:hypothetical protein